jgi:hypothetical protein
MGDDFTSKQVSKLEGGPGWTAYQTTGIKGSILPLYCGDETVWLRYLFILLGMVGVCVVDNTLQQGKPLLFQHHSLTSYLNPILHTWFRDSCFTCDGASTTQVFHLLFNIGMVI